MDSLAVSTRPTVRLGRIWPGARLRSDVAGEGALPVGNISRKVTVVASSPVRLVDSALTAAGTGSAKFAPGQAPVPGPTGATRRLSQTRTGVQALKSRPLVSPVPPPENQPARSATTSSCPAWLKMQTCPLAGAWTITRVGFTSPATRLRFETEGGAAARQPPLAGIGYTERKG